MICEGKAKKYCCEDISKIENYGKRVYFSKESK